MALSRGNDFAGNESGGPVCESAVAGAGFRLASFAPFGDGRRGDVFRGFRFAPPTATQVHSLRECGRCPCCLTGIRFDGRAVVSPPQEEAQLRMTRRASTRRRKGTRDPRDRSDRRGCYFRSFCSFGLAPFARNFSFRFGFSEGLVGIRMGFSRAILGRL